MIPKSGIRFSGKIMLKQRDRAPSRFHRDGTGSRLPGPSKAPDLQPAVLEHSLALWEGHFGNSRNLVAGTAAGIATFAAGIAALAARIAALAAGIATLTAGIAALATGIAVLAASITALA